jgi:hypothetical protein
LEKSLFSILLPLHMICGNEVILQDTAVNSGLSDTKVLAVWIMSPKLLFEVVVRLFTLFNYNFLFRKIKPFFQKKGKKACIHCSSEYRVMRNVELLYVLQSYMS